MDKKIVFFELPLEIVNQISSFDVQRSQSEIVTELLQRQLSPEISAMNLHAAPHADDAVSSRKPSEIQLLNHKGLPLGTFDVNSAEAVEHLAQTIGSLSDDPLVRMKVRRWR